MAKRISFCLSMRALKKMKVERDNVLEIKLTRVSLSQHQYIFFKKIESIQWKLYREKIALNGSSGIKRVSIKTDVQKSCSEKLTLWRFCLNPFSLQCFKKTLPVCDNLQQLYHFNCITFFLTKQFSWHWHIYILKHWREVILAYHVVNRYV